MKQVFIYFIAILVLFTCCNKLDKFLCGDLEEDYEELFQKASKKYSELYSIKVIPCENYYLNVELLTDKVDTMKIIEIHEELYAPNRKVGWPSIHVYGKNEEFLFTHSYSGKILTTPPNW